MSTKLYNTIIVGPIHSRRLGSSLGINVLPEFGKFCSFDCIYCECGWNKDNHNDKKLPTKEEVGEALEKRLRELDAAGTKVDSITFSGNGEPTLNPEFPEIVDITLKLRDELYPSAKVSVLTNASQVGRKEVREALMKIDNPILKIDSAIKEYVDFIDRPCSAYSLDKTIENIKLFKGNFILQTMFLRGTVDGKSIDCRNAEHCRRWIELVKELKPREIMMYTLDRDTPAEDLQKVTPAEMAEIAKPLVDAGFKVQIKG